MFKILSAAAETNNSNCYKYVRMFAGAAFAAVYDRATFERDNSERPAARACNCDLPLVPLSTLYI